MHDLFAFNISKEVNDIPTVLFKYDPNQQVTLWMGDETTTAYYCTQVPYNGRRCEAWQDPGGPLVCITSISTVQWYNFRCDG